MKEWIKRAAALTMVFLCLCASAAAEFSPAYSSLMGRENILLRLSLHLDGAPDWTEGSVNAANALLQDLTAELMIQGQDEALKLDRAGETIFSVARRTARDYIVTSFAPSGGAYITEKGEKDALALLIGAEECVLPDAGLISDYPGLGTALFSVLGKYQQPKASKQSTSIKNTAGSASFETYTFADGELTKEIWTEALEGVLPYLQSAMRGSPDALAQAEQTLRGLAFFGECRFKRFLDRDGQDMGLQFTGSAALGDDRRKVTLYFGFTPDQGGYISLNLPAVKGKNTLKFSLEYKLTGKNGVKNLTASFTLDRTLNGETFAAQGDIKLKNETLDGKENWSGKITLSRTENKVRTVCTLTPALTGNEGGLAGTVQATYQEGKQKSQWTAGISLLPFEETALPAASAARDLRGMDEDAARAVVSGEWTQLTGKIAEMLLTLPEDARWQLNHQLRTGQWMNGPAAALLEDDSIPEGWTVEEDDRQ